MSDQHRAPIADLYDRFPPPGARPVPFMIPGHKGSTDLVGRVVEGDLSLWGALATMRSAAGVLVDAEQLAAELWGADLCRFSVAGSSHGNQALALSVGRPGDEVVVTRAVHRSLLLGFVLAGLRPVWVAPPVDAVTGLPGRLPVDTVRSALAAHPGARAVFAVEPGYAGTRSDVSGLAGAAHDAGVPLLVDQAWSAHFGFHPALPPHALAAGADAFVTSAHKALPAYTQGALVLARTERLDRDRLAARFRRDAHDEPVRDDPREHRRGPQAAGAGRRAPARPDRRARHRRTPPVGRRGGSAGAGRSRGRGRPDPAGARPVRDRRGRVRRRGRPGAARVLPRDGRPGHPRGHRHDGGQRRVGRPAGRRAGRGDRPAPGAATGRAARRMARQRPARGRARPAGGVLRRARDRARPTPPPGGWPPSWWRPTRRGSRPSSRARC